MAYKRVQVSSCELHKLQSEETTETANTFGRFSPSIIYDYIYCESRWSKEDLGYAEDNHLYSCTYTISSVTKLSSSNLQIKRKYKLSRNNPDNVTKWWFVVRDEESVHSKTAV